MRAAPGAIQRVRLTPEGAQVETIFGAPPLGLCGSGIVDALAELWRHGILDERGRLRRDAQGVRQGDGGFEFVVVPGSESGTGRDIVVTQRDIGEVQLAKSAILATVQTLLEVTRTAESDVEDVMIAGAFGAHFDLDSVRAIGLLPPLPNARFVQLGNAAGVGAKMTLVSAQERERAVHLARRAQYLELNTNPGFNRRFAAGMRFPPLQAGPTAHETRGQFAQ
jgi:uncharacterized 2Fe-2S/4Fe-4S cluster protein (DUF4445 family)